MTAHHSHEGMTMDAKALEEALDALHKYFIGSGKMPTDRQLAALGAAGREQLATLPRTKEVEVWRVEYTSNHVPNVVQFDTRKRADEWVRGVQGVSYVACVKITGPHLQTVPA